LGDGYIEAQQAEVIIAFHGACLNPYMNFH